MLFPTFPTSSPQTDLSGCFIQKQDTVTIPPLSDPQLQNAAFSVIEAAKAQLSELKLADLFSQQLKGDDYTQFISEFLYHWAGLDAKPPEALVESSRKQLHSMVSQFVSTNRIDPAVLVDVLCPLLEHLASPDDVQDLLNSLTRTCATAGEEGANLVDLATLGTVMSEVARGEDDSHAQMNEAFAKLQTQRLREVQQAFDLCLRLDVNGESADCQISVPVAVFGSENAASISVEEEAPTDS
jgi:hypothetical protein